MHTHPTARRAASFALAAALSLAGCSQPAASGASAEGATTTATTQAASASPTYVNLIDTTDLFSDRDLNPSYDALEVTATVELADNATKATGSGLSISGNTVTISEEGIYVFSGALSNGQIAVDVASGKVQLVLNGVSIANESDACIWVSNASKVFVTLADGSENTLATTAKFNGADSSTDGVIFSRDDLTINGSGSLGISAAYGNGVVCKDKLRLVSGTLDVWADDNAFEANDFIALRDGTYTVSCGKNAFVADNDDTDLGYVYVEGGTVSVTGSNDGLHASGKIQVDGGHLSVTADDDAFHAEYELAINGGVVEVPSSHEALEGSSVYVAGGEVTLVAEDDGINANGEPGSSPGGDSAADEEVGEELVATSEQVSAAGVATEATQTTDADADETALIAISGGTLSVTSDGDGIDSNGTIVVSGGTTTILAGTDTLSDAVDFGISATISGGTFVALGTSYAAEGFSADSTQASALVTLPAATTGTATLTSAGGAVVATLASPHAYDSVLVSVPELEVGGAYTLSAGTVTESFTLVTTSNVVVPAR